MYPESYDCGLPAATNHIYDETGAAACNIHCYTVIGFW